MAKGLKVFLVIIVVLLMCGLCGILTYVAYLGFVPGLSSLFKSNKPADLGITYTEADYDSYNEKVEATIITKSGSGSPDESIKFSGSENLDVTLTDEEVSARIAYAKWKYTPISQPQVRFNEDGTLEVSGVIVKENIIPFLTAAGYAVSDADTSQALEYLDKLPIDPAIYAKGTAAVVDNQATIELYDIRVGNFSLNPDVYGADEALNSLANQIFADVEGLEIESVTFDDGEFHFVGNAPTTIEVEE